jgi:hypothetical protein
MVRGRKFVVAGVAIFAVSLLVPGGALINFPALAQVHQDAASTDQPPIVGEEAREERRVVTRAAAPVERGGALLPSWRFVVEPSFEYDHFSSQVVSISGFTIFEAILIGRVSVDKVKRDIFIPAMTFRLGMKSSEINVRIPYMFRRDKLIAPRSGAGTAELVEKNFSDNDLGDIEAYFYHQLIREGQWRRWVPDVIVRLGGKFPTGKDPYGLERQFFPEFGTIMATEFPTGTGHWGLSIGSTFIKSIDPAVVFFNWSYFINFERDVGVTGSPPADFGTIDLGNAFEYNIGLVLALQERLSMNFSYNQRTANRTTRNGVPLTDTGYNAISFKIGATYVISPIYTLDFVVGLGLSDDAPDVSVLARFPISYQF